MTGQPLGESAWGRIEGNSGLKTEIILNHVSPNWCQQCGSNYSAPGCLGRLRAAVIGEEKARAQEEDQDPSRTSGEPRERSTSCQRQAQQAHAAGSPEALRGGEGQTSGFTVWTCEEAGVRKGGLALQRTGQKKAARQSVSPRGARGCPAPALVCRLHGL